MAVTVETTPNPRARKFTVGVPVGGPSTFTSDSQGSIDEWVSDILVMDGVVSVFLTSDFVTVTGTESIDWASVSPRIASVLDAEF